MILGVCTALFISVYVLLLLYLSHLIKGISRYVPHTHPNNTFISVIVPARNEAERIEPCLQSLSNQDYPKHLYEIIVADDESTDDTAAVVGAAGLSNLQLVASKTDSSNKDGLSSKKLAITTAIGNARGELIVTTDADCVHTTRWLRTIASFYEEKKPAMIVAPVTFSPITNLISLFQLLDFLSLQGVTAAAAGGNLFSMCNGANLAYQKDAFEKVGGFSEVGHLASGDDVFLMQKFRKQFPNRVVYLKNPDVVVQTPPEKDWTSFFQQRIRWAGKTAHSTEKTMQVVMLLVGAVNLLLFICGIATLIGSFPPLLLFVFLLVKTIAELYFIMPVAFFFDQSKWLWWFPLAQPFHILYTLAMAMLAQKKTYQWKGRKLK